MSSRPHHNKSPVRPRKPSGANGTHTPAPAEPPVTAHGALPPHSTDFLEFAQAAGGFGVFDLNLDTGDICGTALFFELIGLPHRDLKLSREEWVSTIHP
jgi:hypothetical protein